MAFYISMPLSFKIGDTCECEINFEPKRVTWRNQDTLVIEPDDARHIVQISRDDKLISFFCTDADGTAPHITTPFDVIGI
jgi:hypothetical protein